MRDLIILIINALLALVLLLVSLVHGRLYREARRQYESALTAVPSRLAVDFGVVGEVSSTYRHSTQLPHGVTAYLELRGDFSSPWETHEEAWEALGSRFGQLVLSRDGRPVEESDLGVQFRQELRQEKDVVLLPVGSFRPSLALGDYTLTVRVTSQAPTLAGHPLHLVVRYNCCGLEQVPQRVAQAIAIGAFGAFVVLLWPLARLSRRVWRRRHPPVSEGDAILYVLAAYPRWSETFLRLDLRLLQCRQVPLHAVALYPGDTAVKPDWPQVRVLSPLGGPDGGAGDGRGLAARLQRVLGRFLPRWLRAQLSLRRHRSLLESLLAECREKRIRHIHAEFADLAALLAVEAARQLGCSFSLGIHAFDIHACKYPLRRLFGEASFITVCNEAAAVAFRRRCPWAAERLHLIHHGLDLKQWPFVGRVSCEPCLKLLFVGRLVPKKGIHILLKALDLLVNTEWPSVQLTIVGDGPLGVQLRRQAEQDGVTQHVHWKGVLDQEAVREQLRQSSCLCVPSVVDANGDRDGIPNVVTEAMATGVPVVGSQAGSLSEVLSEETGWPVAEPTPETLAAAILAMASQPDERERRRKNARQQMEFRFNAKKLSEFRGRLFEQAMTGASAPAAGPS